MICKGLLSNTTYIQKGIEFCFSNPFVFGKVKVCIHAPVTFEACKLMI